MGRNGKQKASSSKGKKDKDKQSELEELKSQIKSDCKIKSKCSFCSSTILDNGKSGKLACTFCSGRVKFPNSEPYITDRRNNA